MLSFGYTQWLQEVRGGRLAYLKVIQLTTVSVGRPEKIFRMLSRAADGNSGAAEELGDQTYPKTHAKELYCLTDKDLSPLSATEKRNPYVRSGTPMKLYKQRDVSKSAKLVHHEQHLNF